MACVARQEVELTVSDETFAPVICKAHNKREKRNNRKIAERQRGHLPESCVGNDTKTACSERSFIVETPYISKCKVVLVGIGADEQLAGYGRHRTVHRRDAEAKVTDGIECVYGATLLEQELDKDVTRLWKRNLGR